MTLQFSNNVCLLQKLSHLMAHTSIRWSKNMASYGRNVVKTHDAYTG